MPDLVIGIDCSTSGTKAIVWDCLGNQVACGSDPIPMLRLHSGWHEVNADDLWTSTANALREACGQIDPARLVGLSISIQRETFVPVGADLRPLRNAILWMDTRARGYLAPLEAQFGREQYQSLTGKRMSVNLAPPKISWLRDEEPEIFNQTAQFWDVHALLTHHLCGTAFTAWGCAGPMGLVNLRAGRWSPEILDGLGIRSDQLPPLFPTGEIGGTICPAAAAQTGLPVGLPVVAGIGDGQASGIGTGITRSGPSYLTLGTSGITGTYSRRFIVGDAFRTMVGGARGTYLLETALMGCTYTIDWFMNQFFHRQFTIAEMESAAKVVPPGADGLLLVPYWNSVLNPYWDGDASGIVIGWRGTHQPQHLYRAILEGTAHELRLHSNGVEAAQEEPITHYVAMGGGSRSDLWCQIIADVSGKPVFRARETEAASLGAGILAAAALGLHEDVPSAARRMTHMQEIPFDPDRERHAFYDRIHQDVYLPLYPTLRPILKTLREGSR
ncbi:MAG: hypothetical protein JW750_11765 [Anaerolineaceae bacterium]|nr:hypothetical protein [Anaerolineaceae bacterium]